MGGAVTDDRSSNVDYEDCDECAQEIGSGICSNCEDDGGPCPECNSTGVCSFCDGTGRKPWMADPAELERIRQAGPLIVPESES